MSQLELDVGLEDCTCLGCRTPDLVRAREMSAGKPFKGRKAQDTDLDAVVRAVGEHRRFPLIHAAVPGWPWGSVCRDLLRAQHMGLVRAVGDDCWEVVSELSDGEADAMTRVMGGGL